MLLAHGWGWLPPQTASQIHLRHLQSVWTHWYAVHWHMTAALHSYPPYLAQIWGFWVAYGVEMMSLHHGWDWLPPQTASLIYIRHTHSIWAQSYAVHMHKVVAALHSITNPTWLRFWGSRSLMELKWCDYATVEADHHLKLLPKSILDIYQVFEHIDMLSICIWYQPYTVIHPTWLRFGGSGSLMLSQNDVIRSWLRLTATSNYFPHQC